MTHKKFQKLSKRIKKKKKKQQIQRRKKEVVNNEPEYIFSKIYSSPKIYTPFKQLTDESAEYRAGGTGGTGDFGRKC